MGDTKSYLGISKCKPDVKLYEEEEEHNLECNNIIASHVKLGERLHAVM